MIKEASVGSVIALVIFLAWQGYNVVPFIILGIFAIGLYFFAEQKGLIKSVNFGMKTEPPKAKKQIEFSDIGGQTSAIQELKEALDFIVDYEEIKKLGIRPLKGILLTGPPGTGKTLLAKAAATYTDSAFTATSGSEFIEMYAGVGAQRVRKLFKNAKDMAKKNKKENAIIFIDEIDVLAAKRGQNSGHMEYDQTLNQLLVEMDGMKTDQDVRVLIMAATNRVDLLDPAILRPGRFDRQVKVDLPDRDGRKEILKLHMANKPVSEAIDLDGIAKETFGFSGAQLESLTNEAAIYAMRAKKSQISQEHFLEAIEKVILGEKVDKKTSQTELRRVAVHEVGHALLSELSRSGSVSNLTVTPRGGALGYMRQTPEDDTYLYTKDYLEKQIRICLAGALTEELLLGSRSTGSGNDFQQAANLARKIVATGMSELGVIDPESIPQGLLHKTVTGIIKAQEEITKDLLKPYKEAIVYCGEVLLEHEKLTGEQFRTVIHNKEVA